MERRWPRKRRQHRNQRTGILLFKFTVLAVMKRCYFILLHHLQIKCQVKSDRLGLGAEEAGLVPTTSSKNGKQTNSSKRLERLAKTIDRFNEAKTPDETNDSQDQDLHL